MVSAGDVESDSESFGELWKAVFATYYDAFYNEALADRLVNKWQFVDGASKILVALTASGSAISGWALWSQPGYRTIWTVLASVAALLGIIHGSLGVAHRLRDWSEIKRAFSMLCIELETLQYRMKFDFRATTLDFKRQFIKYRKQYVKADQLIRADLFLTNGLRIKTQKHVNMVIEQDKEGN